MISEDQVEAIAEAWIKEFSVDPYSLSRREMDAWFKLDALIYKDPTDALRVFEKIAEKDLINWTFEGIAVGPLRSFMMLYEGSYDGELSALRGQNIAFDEMYALALEGL
jgi:hypothetical protein